MYEILLTQKVSAENHEAPEFLESDYDANYLYQVDHMSLEETKEKLDWCKRAFEYENKNSYGPNNHLDQLYTSHSALHLERVVFSFHGAWRAFFYRKFTGGGVLC